jgi:hypothetical protein
VTRSRLRRIPFGTIGFLILVVLLVVACAPGGATSSGGASPSPSYHPPLTPAQPGADPISLLAWLFNPIFQAMLIIMVGVYSFLEGLGVPAAIGWAIVVLTLVVRTIVIPLVRKRWSRSAGCSSSSPRSGDPEALQGRRDEGAGRPAEELFKNAASTRLPAASRSCSRCRCCSSCIRSSRTA